MSADNYLAESKSLDLKGFYQDDTRSLWRRSLVALALALVFHLILFLVVPERLMPEPRAAKEEEDALIYEIDLVEPDEMRFVEANPDAPVNEPDRQDQYSFRAQQAADQNPLSDASNMPTVEGEEDSQKILQGVLEQPPPVPPGVYAPNVRPGEGEGTEGGKLGAEAAPQVSPAQPLPAPNFIAQKPVSEDGPGSRVDISGEAKEVFERFEENAPLDLYKPTTETQAEVAPGDGAGGAAEARPAPRARPRLAAELLSGPLMQSRSSARLRGDLAIDSTFSEFGEYQQQFYAAVQTGWYQEIEFFQPIDTAARVHVRFRMKADGTVDNVKAVYTTASKIATVICETAITKRSPFRPWTREMVEVFGEERWLSVVFHYR